MFYMHISTCVLCARSKALDPSHCDSTPIQVPQYIYTHTHAHTYMHIYSIYIKYLAKIDQVTYHSVPEKWKV